MSGGGEYQRLQDAPEDIEYGFTLPEQLEPEDAATARHAGFAPIAANAAMHPPPTAPSSVDTTGSHGKGAAIMQQHYPPRAKDRKKKFGRKMSWLVMRQDGSSQTVVMDKRQLTQVMGLEIPMRDLRLMDPTLQAWEPYAQILVRDNAMVISIEHARLILSADKVLIPLDFEKTEVGERFIKHLEATIRERAAEEAARRQATAAAATAGGGSSGGGAHAAAGGAAALGAGGGRGVPAPVAVGGRESVGGIRDDGGRDVDLDLPFELHMLEVALGEVCRHLAQQVAALEALAHPALDALTRNADTLNLERVRKIKTQHQRLGGRVAGLREVLERYLEDDQDMYRMCLSKRRDTDFETGGSDNTLLLSRASAGRHLAAVHLLRHSHSIPKSPPAFLERLGSVPRGRRSSDSDTSSATSGDVHDLLEVENLLESYYSLVDSTHAKINAIGEYIDDTEDLINIELDYSRNRLLRLEILITVATFCLALHNLLAGILGENLVLPSTITQDLWGFALINGTALATCIALFFLAWRMMAKLKMI